MPDSAELPTLLSLADLFGTGHYVVPIYQRNYAWTEAQITQLIQDVRDAARAGERDYYLGTLVVFARGEGCWEVIDGQQRHTTLSILLSVLKNRCEQKLSDGIRVNLEYDCRPRSKQTLLDFFATGSSTDPEPSLKEAFEVCEKTLSESDERIDVARFTAFLLDHVMIVRVQVPPQTDLNHYFEIMNNRGAQLEKHEVLKARLMDTLDKRDRKALDAFATIWDACSDMNRYVQYGFPKAARKGIFGEELNDMPGSFEDIQKALSMPEITGTSMTILECLDAPPAATKETAVEESDEASERFGSLVTFPNFLLHALRIHVMDRIRNDAEYDIALDDKSLLTIFEAHSDLDAKAFVVLLLRLRLLLDRYLIKREWEKDWSLQQLKWYSRDSTSYVNTFGDTKEQQACKHLLSMLHVSFPSPIYKHWLTGILLHLHESTAEITGSSYLAFLERYDSRLFFGRFSTTPREYRDLVSDAPVIEAALDRANLNEGTKVHNYVFNRLDYLIWKVHQNLSMDPSDELYLEPKILQAFAFSFRSSVEHFFPQHPLPGLDSMAKSEDLPLGVDSFGNLCLISHSANSKLSNYSPTAKKDHYHNLQAVESLKQQLMMRKADAWGLGTEGVANLHRHQEAVVKLLERRTEEVEVVALGQLTPAPSSDEI